MHTAKPLNPIECSMFCAFECARTFFVESRTYHHHTCVCLNFECIASKRSEFDCTMYDCVCCVCAVCGRFGDCVLCEMCCHLPNKKLIHFLLMSMLFVAHTPPPPPPYTHCKISLAIFIDLTVPCHIATCSSYSPLFNGDVLSISQKRIDPY